MNQALEELRIHFVRRIAERKSREARRR